jgi:hypothetical protein
VFWYSASWLPEARGRACAKAASASCGVIRAAAIRAYMPFSSYSRGDLLSFLGCSLEPPTFASAIKCHQKSTSNSAGSSVGSLARPRATPRLGGVYVSCQYFPCSCVLALRELGLRLGVKAQLPLRASSRGVLPGAGALAGYRHSKCARDSCRFEPPKRDRDHCSASWPAHTISRSPTPQANEPR